MLFTNSKKKIRIGIIYTTQENVTPNHNLKIMYEDILSNIKQCHRKVPRSMDKSAINDYVQKIL